MCCIIFRCLVLLIMEFLPFLFGETIEVSIFLIMPDSARLNKKLKNALAESYYTDILRDLKRSKTYSGVIKQSSRIIDTENPQDILDLFCENIFKEKVNTILYFQLHPTKDPTPNYIINMAEYLRIPVISWDLQFPGALEVCKLFLLE